MNERRGPGLGAATAMYVAAVLGPGVLVLPALAADAAGPASVLAWLGLLLASAPVAAVFAVLGTRYRDGGGVATFAGRAFGPRTAAVVGWWFYAAVPAGVLAGALVGGEYAAAALGGGRSTAVTVAVVILVAAFGVNAVGLHLSGRVQLILTGLLVALLCGTVSSTVTEWDAANFTPFLPGGPASIGHAAVVLFYAFTGWEAVSHLSGEFARPGRDVPRATALALTIVALLYLGLSAATIGVLGDQAAESHVPLLRLLERGWGAAAAPITAGAAILLSFGAVNTFVAGAARLGAALARDGALPALLSRGGEPGQVPRRSLSVQAVMTGALAAVSATTALDLEVLMRATSVLLAAVTLAGMLAALRLLNGRRPRWSAATGALFTGVVLAFGGKLLLVPGLVAAAALARFWATARRDVVADHSSAPTAAPTPIAG